MAGRSTYAPERVETAGNPKTQVRRVDKNFDDIFGIANDLSKRLRIAEKALRDLKIIISTNLTISIVHEEAEERSFMFRAHGHY